MRRHDREVAAASTALTPLVLTADEHDTLLRWTRRAKTSQALALRGRWVLACAAGLSSGDVAIGHRVDRVTVGRLHTRVLRHRLDDLFDEPRPRTPRTIADKTIEDVVRLTLEPMPVHARQWSTRCVGARAGLSRTTVMRIWHAFELQSHRTETLKLSADPLFIRANARRRGSLSRTSCSRGTLAGRSDA